MNEDSLGNPVGTASPQALAGINDFVEGFLAYETKAGNIFAAAEADPGSALANIYAGFSWMFLEAPDAASKAQMFFERAAAAETNHREAMLLGQLQAWMRDDIPAVQAIGDQIIAEFPRDLASVKLHQYFSFNRGDASAMLRVAEQVLPHNIDNPHLHGMLAFGLEQSHRIPEAETAARRAIELKQKEPWAQHALAHVMLSTGRVREGLAFLDDASRTWDGLNSFMYTHNWWHKALFHISLGDEGAVLDAYDNHVWGMEKGYSQDQVNAVSLLARMEMAGIDVGDRWDDVANHLAPRAADTVQPFLSLQYLYGLARAERLEADRLMGAIADKAARSTGFDAKVWREVALPAALGVLAHARGNFPDAVRHLRIANPRMGEIGGSHAQRDLFSQILLDGHRKIGNWAIARRMMEMRRTWDPDGVPLARMIAEADGALGTQSWRRSA
jgi:hypothetical protein